MGNPSGRGIGGNVFWKQWHIPVKTNGSLAVEEEEEEYEAEEYYEGFGGPGGIRGHVRAEEYESDRRPWTDLIPRFRVKVEPLTTLKVSHEEDSHLPSHLHFTLRLPPNLPGSCANVFTPSKQ